jgi:hypothetical protein
VVLMLIFHQHALWWWNHLQISSSSCRWNEYCS